MVTPTPSSLKLQGGDAGPSAVSAKNDIRFGDVIVKSGGEPWFWIAVIGGGYLAWMLVKRYA